MSNEDQVDLSQGSRWVKSIKIYPSQESKSSQPKSSQVKSIQVKSQESKVAQVKIKVNHSHSKPNKSQSKLYL